MQAFIPSQSLFHTEIRYNCEGITAYEDQRAAGEKSLRRRNVMAKNQYFSVIIPDETRFLESSSLISKQPDYIINQIFGVTSLSLLYAAEEKDFTDRLAIYLMDNGALDNPDAAEAEITNFYNHKREAVKELDALAYIDLIKNLAKNPAPAVVSAYLSHIGISGLIIHEPDRKGRSFLLFNPRKDVVIKEVIRTIIPGTKLAS